MQRLPSNLGIVWLLSVVVCAALEAQYPPLGAGSGDPRTAPSIASHRDLYSISNDVYSNPERLRLAPRYSLSGSAYENASARQDLYTTYTDAYMNPETLASMAVTPPLRMGEPGRGSVSLMQRLLNTPRVNRIYFSGDYVYWRRQRSANKPLVHTTPNLFPELVNTATIEGSAGFLQGLEEQFGDRLLPPELRKPFINAKGITFFNLFWNGIGTGGSTGQLIDANTVFTFFEGFAPVISRQGIPANEILTPYEIRMETDDFANHMRHGFRPTLGIELGSGNRIEISYTQINSLRANLVEGPFDTSFFMRLVVSNTNATGGIATLQRFGILSSPFRLFAIPNTFDVGNIPDDRITGNNQDPLSGEVRQQWAQVTSSGVPIEPDAENPPLAPSPINRSQDVPREPTNSDFLFTGNPIPFSMLYSDGEFSTASVRSDLLAAEMLYRRRVFWEQLANTQIELLAGLRLVRLDEEFSFFFADTLFDRSAAQTTFHVDAQTAAEVSATYISAIDNVVLGPQVGLDVRFPFRGIFEFAVMSKGGFAANHQRNRIALIRGDGLVFTDSKKSVLSTSSVFEGKLGLVMHPLPNVTLRGGLEYLWLVNIGTAIGNIDYDVVPDQTKRPSNGENILYYGFYAGGELIF